MKRAKFCPSERFIRAGFILLFTISSSLFTLCEAQYVRPGDTNWRTQPAPMQNPPKTFQDNLSVGGTFGLQFGDVTFVELEPLVNYHFGESFMAGIGPIYQYENVSAQVYGYAYKSSLYGARVTAMYFLPEEFSKIFIMGEYDVINVPEINYYYQLERGYLTLPFLGLGYKSQVSDKLFFFVYGLWNFNTSYYNPFSNPIINVGFDLGLWR